jgi:hypothetical protein
MVSTMFLYKNAFAIQKEQKTRHFQPLKNAEVLWGQFLAHLNLCPWRFFDDVLGK